MTSSHLPVSIKFYFGLGQAADYIKNFGFGTLLMLYYNQVLGLSGAYAGAAVSISIAFDAISDPMVGSWSDGYRSRWGRRLPFMVGAAVPLGVTFYCLFMPPVGLNEFGLFLWLTSFAVLSRTALTFFNVPYYEIVQFFGHCDRVEFYICADTRQCDPTTDSSAILSLRIAQRRDHDAAYARLLPRYASRRFRPFR